MANIRDLKDSDIQEYNISSLNADDINIVGDESKTPTPEAPQESRLGEAMMRGVTDYTLLGGDDELGAGFSTALEGYDRLAAKTSFLPTIGDKEQIQKVQDLQEKGELDKQSLGDAYRETRDQDRELKDSLSEQHPVAYHGTGLAASMLTGGAASKVGKLNKLLTTKKGLAGVGAVGGLGSSKAELTGENKEIGSAVFDTVIGGTAGVVIPKALQGLQAKRARKAAAKRAFKSLKPNVKAKTREMDKEIFSENVIDETGKKVNTSGEALLESYPDPKNPGKMIPILKNIGDSKELSQRITKAIDHNEEQLTPLLNEVQALLNKNPNTSKLPLLGDDISDLFYDMTTSLRGKKQIGKEAVEAIESNTDLFEHYIKKSNKIGNDVIGLNDLKREIGASIDELDFSKTSGDITGKLSAKKNIYVKMYSVVRKRIENLGDNVSEGQLGQEIRDLNHKVSNLINARGTAVKDAVKQGDRIKVIPSLRESAAMGVGMYHGQIWLPALYGAKVAAEQVSKKDIGQLANTMSAKMLSATADAVEKIPGNMRKVADEIRKTISLPLARRATEVTQIYLHNKEVLDKYLTPPDNKKESTAQQGRLFSQYGVAQIDGLAQSLEESDDRMAKVFSKELKLASTKDTKKRRQKLSSLWQKPDFRKLLRKLNGEPQDEGEE